MHVQGKILILEPLGIELDLFIPRTKTNYVNNLIFKIPAKTHFLCLQALLNVEVLEIQRYAKMQCQEKILRKKIWWDSTNIEIGKKVLQIFDIVFHVYLMNGLQKYIKL